MKRNSFSRFLMGKGLYVALVVCLAGAGTAAWVTVNNRISEPTPFAETPPAEVQPQENINPSLSAEEPHINTEETAPVEQKQPQVSKEESKPIEESSSSSSSVSLPEDTSASVSTSEPLHMNMTLTDYLNDQRLTLAAHALTYTNHSILTICTDIGFSSVSYFNKIFKAKYACTPLAFRKKQFYYYG